MILSDTFPNPAMPTHSKTIGYLLWIFGLTGILWLLTAGLLGIGWIYDSFTLNGQIDERNRTPA